MKKLFLISCALLSSLLSVAQKEADPVVMTVANEPITRSEFEYNFNKNNTEDVVDKKTVREYADLYAIYKMKVRAALDAKMDTISSFQKEFKHYRDMQIRPLLVPEVVIEQQCQDYYNGMLEMLEGKDLIRPAHILVMVSQKASPQEQEAKRQLADSIYNAIVQGEDFERLALEKSDDTQSAREGGALPWIGPGNTLQEFEDVAYSLQVGEMSKPFLSPVGYHIIKMLDRKQLEPFDTLHPQIHRFMEQRGVHERLASNALDSISKKYAGKYTTEQILDIETERLCNENQELKYLVKEYHDGLLLYELCSTQIWEPAKTDTLGLEKYFKTNKKQYQWDTPHFSGMMFYCKNQEDVKTVKKLLSKEKDDSKWISLVREHYNKDSVMVRMDKRLFVKGTNNNVDALVFKVKNTEIKAIDGYPYVGFVGKILKKGPAKWTDVGAKVIQDYQKHRENEYVEKLRKQYLVVINEEALSTVNKH
ncbi:MAG: peptidylprolyl isomerase [Bacteroidaceae bacterium]|nr:peptidylprolyl isomerase [Bacteroidaceae bacterium]